MDKVEERKSSIKYYIRKYAVVIFILPALILLIFLYLFPLILLLAQSFYVYVPGQIRPEFTFTLQNYAEVFRPVYANAIILTLWISVVTTIFTVILAYPLAFYLVRSKSGFLKKFVMGFLITSFFMQLLVRVYAFYQVYGSDGVLNQVFSLFGLPRQDWLGGPWPIIVSMVHQGVPIAVLVQMGSIKSINPEVEEASKILGASGIQTFFKITLPLSLPGVIASILLSFTGAASAYVTPLILSQGRVFMMGNYIYDRFINVVNYPFAAAMSVVLLFVSLTIAYGISGILSKWVRVK
jgi:ABC-type spermidine/putrescine transport system permease subunit I